MEHRVPMPVKAFLAACVLLFAAGTLAAAQNAGTESGQSPAESSQPVEKESTSHRSNRHVQVAVEGEQPAELSQAEAAIEKKDYAAAQSVLHTFVEHNPTNYVAWFDLGFVENALGKVDESIAAYRKAVAANPSVFESNLNLGLQLAKTHQPDAVEFLRAATHLKPTSHETEGLYRAWLSLAQTIERSTPEEALAAYQRAASLQPKEAEPHLYAGELFEQQNKFAEAEQEYKQALALDPRSSDATVGLVNIYVHGRRFPEAEDYLRRLVADNANSAPLHLQLGRVLAAEGKNDAAAAELQAGVRLAPKDEALQRELADLYVAAGKSDQAESAYRELLAAHPNDAELHRRLGEALLAEKKFPAAQKEFAAAVKLKPGLGEAYGGLAFAAGENKDYALAIKALDARAKLLPEVAITYFMRGSAYDHLHDFKDAAANYRLFLNSAHGKYPDQEWQAKHRLIAIEPKK